MTSVQVGQPHVAARKKIADWAMVLTIEAKVDYGTGLGVDIMYPNWAMEPELHIHYAYWV